MSGKDEVQEKLDQLPVKSGQRYQHYKGGEYEVITLATQEDTLEQLVVYKSIEHGSTWVRTYQNFTEEVTQGGKNTKRFILIKE